MDEFNEYIETNQWLKKLMDELNEEDGMRLEDAFYAFKKHRSKDDNLPISHVSKCDFCGSKDLVEGKTHCKSCSVLRVY